jgi:hypothetical protein
MDALRTRWLVAARVGLAVTMLGAWVAVAGTAAAQDDGTPAIDATVVADITVEGGDATGGNASGGDAVVTMDAGNTDGGCGCGTEVEQSVDTVTGGTASGGDAVGGDGLNAFVDANLVVDADIGVDVTADVSVVANADAGLAGVLPQSADGLSTSAQPVDTAAATEGVSSGVSDATAILDSLLGSLGGLQLLTLDADLALGVTGGDAVGGNADGGNAVVALSIGDTTGANVAVTQHVGTVTGGLVSGGDATGGDGIELDVLLDADVDLIVDANVDVVVDVVTFATVDATLLAPAQLGPVTLN